jgi:hypothetical protein
MPSMQALYPHLRHQDVRPQAHRPAVPVTLVPDDAAKGGADRHSQNHFTVTQHISVSPRLLCRVLVARHAVGSAATAISRRVAKLDHSTSAALRRLEPSDQPPGREKLSRQWLPACKAT